MSAAAVGATLIALFAGSAQAAEPPPPLNAPIPRTPERLTERLTETDTALTDAIDRWRATGDASVGPAPDAVARWALYSQRIHRLLAHRPRLERATLRRVPRTVARATRDPVLALRGLFSLTPARPRLPRLRTGPPLPADALRAHYEEAERRFGVDWHVLAAVNMVETQFGRLRSSSTAGAQGPMQFLPATWRAYGLGGDVHDPRDAIMGAANYLRASGAPRDYRRALFAYNHANAYVRAVLRLSRRMARGPRAYFAFHSWQVFVRTRSGDRRATSP